MKDSRLMIVVADKGWTLAALHLVCATVRRDRIDVLLLKMVPANHPLLLGTVAGSQNYTLEDAAILADMAATAEDYGVSLQVQLFQYVNYWPGVVDAAGQLGVTAVIAHIPLSSIPYWHDLHRWWLCRQFARRHKLLITLDDLTPALIWMPSQNLQDDLTLQLSQHVH